MASFASIQFVWLNFASHFKNWLPYQIKYIKLTLSIVRTLVYILVDGVIRSDYNME